ncbi:hypothetical protein G5I_14332 [Acromyrmex echinatior]|uniref:Uncharacterized protein n=1 Tax=Acromyrmex echinatior TaxID=103372 RepID=F4X7F3_ACREC|nr:hypothetical protein G5I_14332 [Acromyrmex echinatior]
MTITIRESVVITRETTGEVMRYVAWIIVIFPIAHPEIPIIIIANEAYVVLIKFMSRGVDLGFCKCGVTDWDGLKPSITQETLRIFLEFFINFLVQHFLISNNLRKLNVFYQGKLILVDFYKTTQFNDSPVDHITNTSFDVKIIKVCVGEKLLKLAFVSGYMLSEKREGEKRDEILYRDEIGNLLIYNVSSAASKSLLDSSNPGYARFLLVLEEAAKKDKILNYLSIKDIANAGVTKLSGLCRSIKISSFTKWNKRSFYRIKVDAKFGDAAIDFILIGVSRVANTEVVKSRSRTAVYLSSRSFPIGL